MSAKFADQFFVSFCGGNLRRIPPSFSNQSAQLNLRSHCSPPWRTCATVEKRRSAARVYFAFFGAAFFLTGALFLTAFGDFLAMLFFPFTAVDPYPARRFSHRCDSRGPAPRAKVNPRRQNLSRAMRHAIKHRATFSEFCADGDNALFLPTPRHAHRCTILPQCDRHPITVSW